MAFKSRKELNGELDPKINTKGRTKQDAPLTKRAIRNRELVGILRKIKPHLSESIIVAAEIMRSEEAKDADKLKACTILLNAYRELVGDVYDDTEDEAEEVQPNNAAVFSLKVVNQEG